MILEKKLSNDIVNAIIHTFPNDAQRVVCQIYYLDGCREYSYKYYSKSGTLLDVNTGMDSIELDLERNMTNRLIAFLNRNTIYNRADIDYWNLCIIEVFDDKKYSITYFNCLELDSIDDSDIRESMGYAFYQTHKNKVVLHVNDDDGLCGFALKNNDLTIADGKKVNDEHTENSDFSIPELLGFIVVEYGNDIPEGWLSVRLDAKVQYINNQTHVSTINFYSTSNIENQHFIPSNTIGTMNAVVKIQDIMQKQGQKWSEATFYFKSDGSAQIQVKEGMNS